MGTAGALVGGVPEVLGGVLERVPPRQREYLLVRRDEVGHAGDCTQSSAKRLDIICFQTFSEASKLISFSWRQARWICGFSCSVPVEMMRAWPVGLMLALAHGSIRTLAS